MVMLLSLISCTTEIGSERYSTVIISATTMQGSLVVSMDDRITQNQRDEFTTTWTDMMRMRSRYAINAVKHTQNTI